MVTKPMQEGQVNRQVTIYHSSGAVSTAQEGRREGESQSELERRMSEGGWSLSPQGGGSQRQQVADIGYSRQEGLDTAKSIYAFMPDDILDEFVNHWVKYGDSDIAIGLTRQSKVWENEFGYLRRKDGTIRMSEMEALSNIASFKNTLSEYNIKDFSLFEEKFKGLIEGGTAPLEFQQRIDLVYNQVVDEIPKVKELYARNFGIDATEDAIFASLINEDVEDGVLTNTITTLQIEAEAASRGFTTSFADFQALRRRGMTREQARTLYSSAADIMQSARTVGRELDISTLEDAVLGNTAASNRIRRVEAEVLSQSGATFGSAKKGDEVTGLISD